jgi:hypothetical protein
MIKRLFIFVLIVLFSFACNHKQEEEENLKQINAIAFDLNKDLSNLRQDLAFVTNSLCYKIPYDKSSNIKFEKKYNLLNKNVLSSENKKNSSSIYYPTDIKLTESCKKFIIHSEEFDSLFKETLENNSILSQIYFLKNSSFLRIYPSIDIEKYILPGTDLLQLLTYKSVNSKPFKEKDAIWINTPFADPYGRGWVISCTEPVYYRDGFIGVLSADISISNIRSNYLSSNEDVLLLANSNFELIACTKEGTRFLNIPQFREYQYYKPVTQDLFLFEHSFLLEHKNKGFQSAIQDLKSGENCAYFYLNKKRHAIYASIINETDWYILKITN